MAEGKVATKKPRKKKSWEKYQPIGSLWVNKSRRHKGMQFLSGRLNPPDGGPPIKIFVLFNLEKASHMSPDYNIFRLRPEAATPPPTTPTTEGEV